jgi:hypothetical protein
MFELDTGNNGGGNGPFLQWSARGTQDGVINPKSFYIRASDGKTVYDATKGMVLDIEKMRTGWQKSEGVAGVAPEWKWNPSPSQMMAQPGEDWKKGFSIVVAIGGGEVATWEQAGTAAWQCLVDLSAALQQQPAVNMLPLVRLADTRAMQFKRGSTIAPILEIIKWVPRPDCLKEGAAAGIATAPVAAAPAVAPKPAPVAAPAPAAAAVYDDMEF